jgi:large subunit ribosomal protein L25
MAETVVLKTEKREGKGSHRAEKLRRQGKVPGVLYGHKQATESLSVTLDDLLAVIKSGARVVDIQTASGQEKAQLIEVQYDHLGKDLLHFDLKRVSADERIHVAVRIDLKGIAPGVTAGGRLDQPMHSLHVECPAISVPDSIRVNIGALQVGEIIHVKELALPEGVKALDDPDLVVVHVLEAKAEPVPTEAAPTEGAEPEVIRKAKTEGEEEEK